MLKIRSSRRSTKRKHCHHKKARMTALTAKPLLVSNAAALFDIPVHDVSESEDDHKRKSAGSADRDEPTAQDILCGKVKYLRDHPGNVAFQEVIESFREPYQAARCKQEKMSLTRDVVHLMQDKYHARFLKFAEGHWTPVSESIARDKVSHALRHAANKVHHHGSSGPSSRSTSPSQQEQPAVAVAGPSTVDVLLSLKPSASLPQPKLVHHISAELDALSVQKAALHARKQELLQEEREAALRRQSASDSALEHAAKNIVNDIEPENWDVDVKRLSYSGGYGFGLSFEEWDAVATLLCDASNTAQI